MEALLRASFMYFFLLLVLRISGSRTLNEMNAFDFVLLLVMGDCTQQAITSNDYSVTNAVLIITTLIVIDIFLSFVKNKWPHIEHIIDGTPLILIENGSPRKKIMEVVKIDVPDILESARKWRGLERLDQIKYAILEKDGNITIVPNEN